MNPSFSKLPKTYLFSTIAEKVKALPEGVSPLNLGVGDIAFPLAPTIQNALKEAANEMSETVHGYGPAEGYLFLREKILETEYAGHDLSAKEIFISEGIVRDICDIQEIFEPNATVGIIDPTYPAYLNTSLLNGRKVTLIPCLEENGFIPLPPKDKIDFIYICSPNNPTGVAMTKDHLKLWIDWAVRHGSTLLFDAAYEKFISSPDVPKTIYEIPGAKEVAIEFRSFSKSAGFTGLRLGYTIIPKEQKSANLFWRQRQDIKTNGVSYPIQKAGFQTLFGECKKEVDAQVELYSQHAQKLKETLTTLGFTCYGGVDSPYIWWKLEEPDSWKFFDYLLNELHLIGIPGRGFGLSGEGFMRLSSFITKETLNHATQKLQRGLCATK